MTKLESQAIELTERMFDFIAGHNQEKPFCNVTIAMFEANRDIETRGWSFTLVTKWTRHIKRVAPCTYWASAEVYLDEGLLPLATVLGMENEAAAIKHALEEAGWG